MKLVSRTNRPYLLAGVVLLLLFGVLQVAETVWNKPSSPSAEEAASRQTLPPPEPIRPEVLVDGDRITIEVAGQRTSIMFGSDDESDLEALKTCLEERLQQAFTDDGSDGVRREATLPLLQGFRDRRRLHDPVNGIVMTCLGEVDRPRPRSLPSGS